MSPILERNESEPLAVPCKEEVAHRTLYDRVLKARTQRRSFLAVLGSIYALRVTGPGAPATRLLRDGMGRFPCGWGCWPFAHRLLIPIVVIVSCLFFSMLMMGELYHAPLWWKDMLQHPPLQQQALRRVLLFFILYVYSVCGFQDSSAGVFKR